MQIFYAPLINGNTFILDETESRHCIKVLRMSKGEQVNLIDGKGNLYEGEISIADSSHCTIIITKIIKDFEKRDYYLHIAISPLKNPDRFEAFIEKSVELGIDEITPLICDRTEKKGIKANRIERLIISSMKQSLKALKTIFNEPVSYAGLLSKEFNGVKFIAHCEVSPGKKSISEFYSKSQNAIILIGPEGDFTKDEINLAIQSGYSQVHLGPSRLRTETAGIAACHSIYFMNQ
jgi:16S rRNA (uracil1498-N3)-methyltransferase